MPNMSGVVRSPLLGLWREPGKSGAGGPHVPVALIRTIQRTHEAFTPLTRSTVHVGRSGYADHSPRKGDNIPFSIWERPWRYR
jgi:hypothetical protein